MSTQTALVSLRAQLASFPVRSRKCGLDWPIEAHRHLWCIVERPWDKRPEHGEQHACSARLTED